MEQVREFFDNQKVKTFLWNTLGAFLSVLAVYLGDLDPKYNVIIVPIILATTKYLNQRFIK